MQPINREAKKRKAAIHVDPALLAGSTEVRLLLAQARNAAFAEAARGQVGIGLSMLQDALVQQPMSHDLMSDMAALLLSAGELDHAVNYSRQALSLVADHGPSMYALGFALSGKGRFEEAREVLAQLLGGPGLHSLQREAADLIPLARIELARLEEMRG